MGGRRHPPASSCETSELKAPSSLSFLISFRTRSPSARAVPGAGSAIYREGNITVVRGQMADEPAKVFYLGLISPNPPGALGYRAFVLAGRGVDAVPAYIDDSTLPLPRSIDSRTRRIASGAERKQTVFRAELKFRIQSPPAASPLRTCVAVA